MQEPDSRRKLPLSPEIVARLQTLRQADADSWIFQVSNGAPLNPGNWLNREVRPAAHKLGIGLTGWHDFRHFFATQQRRRGVHPKIVSGLLGHTGVTLAMDTYDHLETEDFRDPLRELLCDVMKSGAAA